MLKQVVKGMRCTVRRANLPLEKIEEQLRFWRGVQSSWQRNIYKLDQKIKELQAEQLRQQQLGRVAPENIANLEKMAEEVKAKLEREKHERETSDVRTLILQNPYLSDEQKRSMISTLDKTA